MKPIAVDLFAGAGGLSLGFEMAGFNIVAHLESDPWACETLRKNFPGSLIVEKDINKIKPADFEKLVGPVDVIIGGPPCQGFSLVGRGKLKSLGKHENDPRNKLYKKFLSFVETLQPKAFVMENVPGILMHNQGKTARTIKKHFEKIGYHVQAHLLTASEHGVPQTRKRVFFIGFKKPATFAIEKCDHVVTVKDAIGDLPCIKHGRGRPIMKYKKPAMNDYQLLMRTESEQIHNHEARAYGVQDMEIFSIMRQGMKYHELPKRLKRYRDDTFRDKYKRLVNSEPSWTVVAHLQKDGYMYIHPTQDRTITVREAARLQSFPDKFILMGPRSKQFRQVGNAVPPLLAKSVAMTILTALENKELTPLIQIPNSSR